MATLEFDPRWVVPPGATIRDCLEEQGITPKVAAHRMGMSPTFFERLLNGEEAITETIAASLSMEIGGDPDFWLNREENYRSDLRAGKRLVRGKVPSLKKSNPI